ncbi:MAG: transglutaminase domain-containing protein [Catenulispora sp.]|nr:transglutaminase domain-containing protein [Catenulispora sp.]
MILSDFEVSVSVRDLVAKLLRIPDRARIFTVPANIAESSFRITPNLQEILRKSGLPCRRVNQDWLYDQVDLNNIALHLVPGSQQRKMLQWWARELNRQYGEVHSYRVDVVAQCPSPRPCGKCEFSVLRPDLPRLRVVTFAESPTKLHSEVFTLARSWPQLPAKVLELIDDYSWLKYMQIPAPLNWHEDFILSQGISDCSGFGRLLANEGRARGLTTRFCYGRSLTPPFSYGHYWAEFLVEDVWVPVDSLLIDAMLSWGVLDGTKWDRSSCLGGILGRLARGHRPMLLHRGRPAPVQLQVA